MNNELNINEIVKVESMAVIKQQLDKVEEFIKIKTKNIPKVLKEIDKLSDEEKENKKSEIKNYRTYLNKINNELEEKRKDIHKEIEKPYTEFNEYYSNGVKLQLQNGIKLLDDTIQNIEQKQLEDKTIELKEFANQYIQTFNLGNVITYEDINVKVNLSSSMKSLKDQIKDFCEKLDKDIQLIQTDENKDKLMLEYLRNGYDYQAAKLTLIEQEKQLEELRQQMEKKQEIEKQEEKVVEQVQEVIAPKEIIQEEEILEVTFVIHTTKSNVKKLKNFLDNEGIDYE